MSLEFAPDRLVILLLSARPIAVIDIVKPA
jgi:hypothetical protein